MVNQIPLKVTNYSCTICNRWHRAGSKKFEEHYSQHFKNNLYIGEKKGGKKIQAVHKEHK
jgi:hypothetical protein